MVDVESIADLLATSPEAAQWSRSALADYCAVGDESAHVKAIFMACRCQDATDANEALDSRISVEEPAGFATFSLVSGTGECSLDNMAVSLKWRRRRVGSRLLVAGELWCRAYAGANLWLEVRASNQGAIALYERAGFTQAGRRTGYYSAPVEDALDLSKALGQRL